MHLVAALHRSCQVFSPSNLFIDQETHQFVTYDLAWKLALLHSEWIVRVAEEHFSIQRNDENENTHIIVAYLAQNSPTLLFSVLGCMHSDYSNYCANGNLEVLPVMLNFRWSASEIAKALFSNSEGDSEYYTILLHDEGMEEKAKQAARIISSKEMKHHVHASILPKWSIIENLPTTASHNFPMPGKSNENDSFSEDVFERTDSIILFTSGSTGGPKGVRLSHTALFDQSLAKLLPPCSYCSSTRMVASTVPFFHVGGLSSTLAVIMAGGSLVFPPRSNKNHPSSHHTVFQPDSILKSILPTSIDVKRDRSMTNSNTLVLVPAMLFSLLLLIHKSFGKDGKSEIYRIKKSNTFHTIFGHIKLILIGGQGISSEQLQKTISIFSNARIVQTYACTEAASSITFAQLYPKLLSVEVSERKKFCPEDKSAYGGDFVGIPPPHIRISISPNIEECTSLQKKEQQFLPPYTVGLIATYGSHVMNGYWNRRLLQQKNESRKEIFRKGKRNRWLVTNDLGYVDARGRLYFIGRAKDVIRTGGETVHAIEVEKILRMHGDVLDCAVVALPDDKFGEVVSAAIVLKDNTQQKYLGREKKVLALLKEMRKHCAKYELARYKHPRKTFIISGNLPKNTTGKVLKLKVKEMLIKSFHQDSNEGIILNKSNL